MEKKWYLSKTIWVNVLLSLGAGLLLATKELTLSQEAIQWIMFTYGLTNIGLRTITKEEVKF